MTLPLEEYDRATIEDIQYRVGAEIDGAFGPSTVACISEWAINGNPPAENMGYAEFKPEWALSPDGKPDPEPCVSNYDIRRHIAADPDRAYLCDISHYQKKINFNAYVSSGVSATIMRTTIGVNSEDDRWRENWRELKARNHPVGAYHLMILFWRGKRTDPREAAESFVRKIKQEGVPEIGWWGDAEHKEVEKLVDVEGEESAALWILEWCKTVEALTGFAKLYSSSRVITRLLGDHGKMLLPYMAWWAAYVADDGEPLPLADKPHSLPPGADWSIWQYSSDGDVPGVVGDCDLNVLNGSVGDLHALIK